MVRHHRIGFRAPTVAGAFTLIELLVVMSIIAVLVGFLMPALSRSTICGRSLKDSSQIRGIHQSWLVFSREFNGVFPTPGLIDRQPDSVLGDTPGHGKEDKSQNTTANLHSVCIMQNYYTPEFCVGPTEPSGKVAIKDDYNWEIYNPTPVGANLDTFWDTSFDVNLNLRSNLSYASMPIAGERQRRQWRESLDSTWAILGTRGVHSGAIDYNYQISVTLQIHGTGGQWAGYIGYNDNHVALSKTFYPDGMTYLANGVSRPDNIFRNDNYGLPIQAHPTGYDCWLVICRLAIGGPDQTNYLILTWD